MSHPILLSLLVLLAVPVRAQEGDAEPVGVKTGVRGTIGTGGSYQGDNLAVGASASVTPRNDFYANRAFGVDGGWTFILDDSTSFKF